MAERSKNNAFTTNRASTENDMPKNVGIRNVRWICAIDEVYPCGHFAILLISFGSEFDFCSDVGLS